MADTVIAMPQYGKSGGQVVSILAHDNGDGTYALGVSTGTASAITVAFPAIGSAGASIPIATVDMGGGIYSLKVSGS